MSHFYFCFLQEFVVKSDFSQTSTRTSPNLEQKNENKDDARVSKPNVNEKEAHNT